MQINLLEGFKRFNQFVIFVTVTIGVVNSIDWREWQPLGTAILIAGVYWLFCKFVKYIYKGFTLA